MSRIPLVRVEEMTPEEKGQYDRFPSNLTRALLLVDRRLAEAAPNLANALRASPLEARLREAVILRVAALHGSAYERMQHIGQVHKAGWSDEEIAGIEHGAPPADVADLMRFVDECVQTGDVSDTTFEAARIGLGARDLATVLLLIGHYMMIARFTKVLRVELDADADSWSHEH